MTKVIAEEELSRANIAIRDCLKDVRRSPQNRAKELVELLENESDLKSKFQHADPSVKEYTSNEDNYSAFCHAYVQYLFKRFIVGSENLEIMLAVFGYLPEYSMIESVDERRAKYLKDVYGPRHPRKRKKGDSPRTLSIKEDKILSNLVEVLTEVIVKQGGKLDLVEDVLAGLRSSGADTKQPDKVAIKEDTPNNSIPDGTEGSSTETDLPPSSDSKEGSEDIPATGADTISSTPPGQKAGKTPPHQPKVEPKVQRFSWYHRTNNTNKTIGSHNKIVFIENFMVNIQSHLLAITCSVILLIGLGIFSVSHFTGLSNKNTGENTNPEVLVPGQIIQIQNIIVGDDALDRVLEYVSSDPSLVTVTPNGLLVVQEGQPGEFIRDVDVTMRGESGATETKTYTVDLSQEGYDLPEDDVNDYTPSFRVEQRMRLVGTEEWLNCVEDAEPGDKVEVRISYTNVSNETQYDVMVKDILPNNLRYIFGTTALTNFSNTWTNYGQDSLFTTGINIGRYDPGASAYVDFTAEVIGNGLPEGSNTLVNWSQCCVDQVTLQDYAAVQLYM